MSYTKTKWVTNDLITAEKLNKIEEGLEQAESNSPLIVTFTVNNNISNDYLAIGDKTFNEIDAALQNFQQVIMKIPAEIFFRDSNNLENLKLNYGYFLVKTISITYDYLYEVIAFNFLENTPFGIKISAQGPTDYVKIYETEK